MEHGTNEQKATFRANEAENDEDLTDVASQKYTEGIASHTTLSDVRIRNVRFNISPKKASGFALITGEVLRQLS